MPNPLLVYTGSDGHTQISAVPEGTDHKDEEYVGSLLTEKVGARDVRFVDGGDPKETSCSVCDRTRI